MAVVAVLAVLLALAVIAELRAELLAVERAELLDVGRVAGSWSERLTVAEELRRRRLAPERSLQGRERVFAAPRMQRRHLRDIEAVQQGIEHGRQRFQELLLRLLRQRFGSEVAPRIEQRIAVASFEQIETWSARVLSAATLADLFAD